MPYYTLDQVLNQVADSTNGSLVTEGVAKTSVVLFSGTTQAAAGTLAHAPVTGLGAYNSMTVWASLVGATGGVLDLYLQYSPDGGTTWIDYAHFTQLTAGNAAVQKVFSVTKDYDEKTITTVGSGTTPALAANTVLGGDWGDRLRVLEVAGASTSAGAAIVIEAVFSS